MDPHPFERHLEYHGAWLQASLPLALHALFLAVLIAALLHLTCALLLRLRAGRRHPDELFAALNAPTAVAAILGFLTVAVICCHHQVVAHELEARPWHLALTVAAVALLLQATGRTGLFLLRSLRVERDVRAAASPASPRLIEIATRMGLAVPLRELDGPLPSMTLGRLRPWIALPSALVRRADDGELEAVLWHEASHARGRDNLKRLCCVFSSSLLCWLPTASWMYRHWREACELRCDDEAVTRTRRPLDMAAALLHETRLRTDDAPPSVSPATGPGGVRARVQRLLREAPPLPRSAFGLLALVLALTTVLTFTVLRGQQWIFSLWCLTGSSPG